MRQKVILSIETSCDETSIALVRCGGALRTPKFEVLENIVSSQIAIHRPFGGVVPNLAKREHIKNLPKILKGLEKKHKNLKKEVDYIAVTVGPGLEPALWTGIEFAKALSAYWNKPLVGANHMEGHLYSNWLSNSKIIFPAVALIVSGGHTILLYMTAINKWTKLGETVDDAAGEAFDKVARMLDLPYPGGPEIQKLAAKGLPGQGDPDAIKFPRPMLNKKNYEFSFSGLKTSVLYYLRDNPKANKADVAASFQQAVIDVLVKKTIRAAEEYGAKSILLCGGVSANKPLQQTLRSESEKLKVKFSVPEFQFNTDNAAMIAAAAYINLLQKNKKPLTMEADSNLNL
jgi:N6-L-threonylcarbamoyladenine synthase